MALLNHLFGNRKDSAKKLKIDAEKRMLLWQEHLKNHSQREQLSKFFNYAKADSALLNWSELEKVLDQISSLISEEFVHIKDEERNEKDILVDLEKIISPEHKLEIGKLNRKLVNEVVTQKDIVHLFEKIFSALQLELHTIKLIKEKPVNVKQLLLYLFNLTFFVEASLFNTFYLKFDENGKPRNQMIIKFARAVLLEEAIEDEIISDEEKFVREMVKQMQEHSNEESAHEYRKLAISIYEACLTKIKAPWEDDFEKAIEAIDKWVSNDVFMYKTIKRIKKQYTDVQIKQVMGAFRRAYNLGHFMSMEEQILD